MSDTVFDTDPWRKKRDALYRQWIVDPAAISFVLMVGTSIEMFDDIADADKPVDRSTVYGVMFFLLTEMPMNQFFNAHRANLVPLMFASLNAWIDSNELESGDRTDRARAYVLRDMFIEIVLHVIFLIHGRSRMRELSMVVRKFFLHETIEDYLGE